MAKELVQFVRRIFDFLDGLKNALKYFDRGGKQRKKIEDFLSELRVFERKLQEKIADFNRLEMGNIELKRRLELYREQNDEILRKIKSFSKSTQNVSSQTLEEEIQTILLFFEDILFNYSVNRRLEERIKAYEDAYGPLPVK